MAIVFSSMELATLILMCVAIAATFVHAVTIVILEVRTHVHPPDELLCQTLSLMAMRLLAHGAGIVLVFVAPESAWVDFCLLGPILCLLVGEVSERRK
jgi:hypothetical protein